MHVSKLTTLNNTGIKATLSAGLIAVMVSLTPARAQAGEAEAVVVLLGAAALYAAYESRDDNRLQNRHYRQPKQHYDRHHSHTTCRDSRHKHHKGHSSYHKQHHNKHDRRSYSDRGKHKGHYKNQHKRYDKHSRGGQRGRHGLAHARQMNRF